MNYMNKLDREEKEIVEAFEAGKLKRVPGVKRAIKRYKRNAAAPCGKTAEQDIEAAFGLVRARRSASLADMELVNRKRVRD